MLPYLATMCGLGVLGFDPAPMVIAGASRAAGVRKSGILAFAVALIGGTALWGVVLTVLFGPAIHQLHLARLADSPTGHWAALVVGIVALAWGIWRIVHLLRPSAGPEAGERPEKARGVGGLLLVALVFVAIVIGDAPFPAAILASSQHHHHLPTIVLGFVAWALISQWPLAVFTVAVYLGVDQRFVEVTQRWLARLKPVFGWVVAVVAVVVGIGLAAWSGWALLR